MFKSTSKQAMLLWLVASLFFIIQFIIRLSVGILREQIMLDFAVDAATFGALSGFYYIGYGASQIPLGVMLDRYSYRVVTSISILATAFALYLFIVTTNWQILVLSRFLAGFGSGVCFLSIAKLTKGCFDEKYHEMLIGVAFTFGLLGAVFSTSPLIILFEAYGHRNVLIYLSVITFIIAAITFIFGNIRFDVTQSSGQKTVIQSLIDVLTNFRIMMIAIAGGLLVGSLEGFADVWAVPFFNQVMGFSIIESSTITMYIYFGMCIGGPILVYFVRVFGSNYFVINLTGLFTIVIFIILFAAPSLNKLALYGLMLLLGIFCCYQVLIFNVASTEVGNSSTGLVFSMINCLNMSFGYIFHTIIGNIFINISQSDNLLQQYEKIDYMYALSPISIGCILGMICIKILAPKK